VRRLRYTAFGPGESPEEGTVADLLFAIPYLIGFGWPFPSHAQLNSLLRKGYADAGMSGGCEWEPFEMQVGEYDDVAHAIGGDPRLARCPTPSLQGSDSFTRCIQRGEWRWDMDRGCYIANSDQDQGLDAIEF